MRGRASSSGLESAPIKKLHQQEIPSHWDGAQRSERGPRVGWLAGLLEIMTCKSVGECRQLLTASIVMRGINPQTLRGQNGLDGFVDGRPPPNLPQSSPLPVPPSSYLSLPSSRRRTEENSSRSGTWPRSAA